MCGFSRVLKAHSYFESVRKPNLFYKHTGRAYFWNNNQHWTTPTFFADMRGTSSVPIYKDTSPLFYAQFTNNPPRWLKTRLASDEFNNLKICRECSELDHSDYNLQDMENGYCIVCGKDFQEDGSYCSQQCQQAAEHLGKVKCRVCGRVLEHNQAIEHHLEYAENKTILVCRSCHLKIHRGVKLPYLKPVDKR